MSRPWRSTTLELHGICRDSVRRILIFTWSAKPLWLSLRFLSQGLALRAWEEEWRLRGQRGRCGHFKRLRICWVFLSCIPISLGPLNTRVWRALKLQATHLCRGICFLSLLGGSVPAFHVLLLPSSSSQCYFFWLLARDPPPKWPFHLFPNILP